MKQYTTEEIQSQFEKLPKNVQEALTSADVNAKVNAIGEKYNLHIDQIGELVDEVGLVMLGLQKPSLFIGDICNRLSINRQIANGITEDINSEIFSLIKRHLQEVEAASMTSMTSSDLERLGDFVIDRTPTAENSVNATTGANNDEGAYVEKRPDILKGIENPQPVKTISVSNTPQVRTDPLVDHLLNTPVAVPPQKIAQSDPYKEPIN